MAENLLRNETSPYLLQHKDNPVHWMAFGDAAFSRARAENKPILLSVGYAACHWCHVMAHESFENPEIAALMNDLMINVKVDREERPDVDVIYQSALAMLGEQGGWPLTMFLTPDGEPFWGGTYFPPTSRWGRPGFSDVLRAIAATYSGEPERIQKNVAALRDGLAQLAQPRGGAGIAPGAADEIAQRLVAEIDMFRGGIKGAPKFPQCGILEQLWRAWKRTAAPQYRDAVVTTLNNICQGGIYDHLGGGFARYSVDEMWLVPHFEKMLYDNAELVQLLTLVWQETRSPLYAQRIAETIDWLSREMVEPGGGFASSLDADSEGVEGKFYVWDEAEIDSALGDDAARFKLVYDVTAAGNWEHKTILNRLHAMELLDADVEATLAECRARLLQIRATRIRPGKDDKVLTDWNALMISALTFAGQAFDRADWLALGGRAYDFIKLGMVVEGRLRHSWRNGDARHPATLDDYANLARAALALHEATGDSRYVADALEWVAAVDRHFHDPAGGYFLAADDTPNLIVRTKSANDAATPSGNGTLLGVLARLHHLTGDPGHRDRAEEILRTFSGEVSRNFFPLSTLINSAEVLEKGLQIVIVGDQAATDTRALLETVNRNSLPDRILTVVSAPQDLPAGHPASGKSRMDGRATAYVCEGPVCSAPVTDPDALAERLAAA